MKYLVYTRVSERGSDWKGESSCSVQADECRRYIQARDPSATFDTIQDEFRSGRTVAKRPALLATLKAAESGRAPWDVLVVLDMDRLSRSLEGWLQVAKTLAAAGKGIACVRQDMDYRTPQGRLVLNLFATVAEYFAHSNAQKTRDKMRAIAERGEWPAGRVPYGYRRAGKSQNALSVDPEASETVKAIFRDASTMHVTALSRKYHHPPNTLRKLLRNPTYLGRIRYGDIDVKGKHPAIVDQATWDHAQANHPEPIAERTPRPARQQYPYALTGLIKDADGHAMTPATCRGKMGKTYPYYRCIDPRCRTPMRYVRADLIEAAVCTTIADLAYNRESLKSLADDITRQAASIQVRYNQGGDLHEALRTAENRARRLLDVLAAAETHPSAVKALLGELETVQQSVETLTAKAKEMDKRLALLAGYSDPDQFAKALAAIAVRISNGAEEREIDIRSWCRSHVHSVIINPDGRPTIKIWLHEPGSTRDGTWHPEGLLVELPYLPLNEAQPPARTADQMAPRRQAEPPRQ